MMSSNVSCVGWAMVDTFVRAIASDLGALNVRRGRHDRGVDRRREGAAF